MNGGMTECVKCGFDDCVCENIKLMERKEVVETAIDVFSRVKRWKIKIIKWFWPDLQRLSDALYDYWDKSD